MAISSFGRNRGDEGVVQSPPPPPPSPSSTGNLTAFIDQGSKFEGKLSFKDTVRIDGHFSGEISSENTLIVGESGQIEATIRSNTVVVSGTVEGDVIAGRQVVVHKTGRVEGNVQTPSLVVEEGALLNGQVNMRQNKGGAPLKAVGDATSSKGGSGSDKASDGGSPGK
jgi:cytoskeletal protein CcmA (bactofilin family)